MSVSLRLLPVLVFLLGLSCFSKVQAQGTIVNSQLVATYSTGELESMVNDMIPSSIPSWIADLLLSINYDLEAYKVTYRTKDFENRPSTATGLVVIPQGYDCDFTMGVYCHGTVFDRYEVPSYLDGNGDGVELLVGLAFASRGYVMALPDYQGLGDGPGFHPYVDYKTGAKATIDIIRAARHLCNNQNVPLNGEVLISGYSQGGHAGMSAIKLIQQKYPNEFNVLYAGLGSGPYNLSGLQYDFIVDNPYYPTRQYILYVLATCQMIYGNLFNQPGDVLVDPYDDLYSEHILGQTGQTDWVPLPWTQMFYESAYNNYVNTNNNPLKACLKKSNVHSWYCPYPLDMFYCLPDEQVDPQNATYTEEVLRDYFEWWEFWLYEQIDARDMGDYPHSDCALPSMIWAAQMFDWYAASCLFRSDQDDEGRMRRVRSADLFVSARGYYDITVDASGFLNNITEVELYNLRGEIVRRWERPVARADRRYRLNTTGIREGTYVLKIKDDVDREHLTDLLIITPEILKSPDYKPIFPEILERSSMLDLSLLEEPARRVYIVDGRGNIARTYEETSERMTLDRDGLSDGEYLVHVVTAKHDYFIPLIVGKAVTPGALPGEIAVSPNPANQLTSVDLTQLSSPAHQIQVIDVNGKILREFEVAPETYYFPLPVNDLPNGVYSITVRMEKGSVSAKLVVNNQ